MLKLTCSYSRKAPAEEDYSSRSYHTGIELELPAGLAAEEVETKIHSTFARLREAVESEIRDGDTTQPHVRHESRAEESQGAKPDARRISNRQAKFALDLARQNGISLNELDKMIHAEYGVPGLYDLTGGKGGQASELIDRLKMKKAA